MQSLKRFLLTRKILKQYEEVYNSDQIDKQLTLEELATAYDLIQGWNYSDKIPQMSRYVPSLIPSKTNPLGWSIRVAICLPVYERVNKAILLTHKPVKNNNKLWKEKHLEY